MADKDAWEKRQSLQKTMFIGTVNLGHIDKTLQFEDEFTQMNILRGHWAVILQWPNLKFARGQIERNKSGNLHIQFGLAFEKPIRGRTLSNKWGSWCDPARNMDDVVRYCSKESSRVEPLEEFGSKPKREKSTNPSPKTMAIEWLLEGKTPADICALAPDVFFTHHRAILETWKMMQVVRHFERMGGEEE